jgi:hypothetical protein
MDRDRLLRTPASPKTLQPPSPIQAERASGSMARTPVTATAGGGYDGSILRDPAGCGPPQPRPPCLSLHIRPLGIFSRFADRRLSVFVIEFLRANGRAHLARGGLGWLHPESLSAKCCLGRRVFLSAWRAHRAVDPAFHVRSFGTRVLAPARGDLPGNICHSDGQKQLIAVRFATASLSIRARPNID